MEDPEYSRLFPNSLLLVEDSPGDASLVMSALKDTIELFEVQCVASLQAAVAELSRVRYGCVIFDLGLPDGDGLDVVDSIRSAASESALVVLTGRDDEALGVLAIQHGADDYFVKSELSARGLHRSINYAIERARSKVQAQRLSAIVESSHDGIISKDLNQVITSWNAGAELLYGYTASEALGQSIAMLVPYDRKDEGPDILTWVSTGEFIDDFETIRLRKDGTLVDVSLRVSPLLGTAGDVVGASIIARDISDRRKAEKLKDEFLAMVSHELRTPLASIVAHVELLLDDGPLEEKRRRGFLEVIDRNSLRLERLVGDLLFVAQLESDHLSLSLVDVDIVKVVKEAIETMSIRARQSDIKITLLSEQPSLYLKGDPGRLGQAVDNLISNAIKYSPPGAGVAVRILALKDTCVIEVEDYGIGIATEELGLLFGRFFRGSTATSLHIQGVGLGLLIVKRIVEGHGGEVKVMSEAGVGTTFNIVLPLAPFEFALQGPSASTRHGLS
jgi:PAS domain S-box-containing protein